MDFETTMAMDGLQRTLEFMRDAFPWISLLVLLITVVGVMLTEKRKRTLLLEQSEEEARIQLLPNLSDAEKEKLLKAAAPLPVTKEAFPLPDLPLRLVSALCKVFGFLKIVLLCGALYSISRIVQMPDSTRTVTNPIACGVLLVLFIVLALLQIFASAKVTRGGNRARRYLIFMAVLEMGGMVQMPDMAFGSLWHGILIAMSAFTLWTLLLRKNAQGAVICEFRSTRPWQKVVILIVCVLSLATKPFDFSMKTPVNYTGHRLSSNSSSAELNGIKLPIERVVLRAGDPSEDTLALMRLLKGALNAPTEVVGFEDAPPRALSGGDLYLLISKTVDGKVKKPKRNKERAMLREHAINESDIPEVFHAEQNLDAEITFQIQSLFSASYLHGGRELRPFNRPNIQLTQSAEYASKSRDEIVRVIADAVATHFSAYIQKRWETKSILRFPDALMIEPEDMPSPELDCMKEAIQLERFFSPRQQVNGYRVSDYSDESVAAISNELVQVGWKHRWDGEFTKENEEIVIRGAKYFSTQQILPYLHLVHYKRRVAALPESFAEHLCQKNYADFTALFYAKTVPVDVLLAATLKYLNTPDLSAAELFRVYDNITDVNELGVIKPDLLLRFARVLRDEPMSEYAFDLYKHLGNAITVDRDEALEVSDLITELYGDQIVHLELEPDTNGWGRAKTTIQGVDRPRLITMSKTQDEPSESREFLGFYILGWVNALEEGKYKAYVATPTASSSSDDADVNSGFIIASAFAAGSVYNGVTGGANGNHDNSEVFTKSGGLCVRYDIAPLANQLTVKVLFKDDRLIVSRAADGDYFLNKERMTDEALIDALTARQVRDGKLRLVVLLEKSDRANFKALLDKLPSGTRKVKYEDPPEPAAEFSK